MQNLHIFAAGKFNRILTQQTKHIALFATVVSKATVCLFCAVAFSFVSRAQERDAYTRINVLFPVNRSVLLRDFANNAESLAMLDRILDETVPGDIHVSIIFSAASPEGPTGNNNSLSRRRGLALRAYILSLRPDLEDCLQIHSLGEAWYEFTILRITRPNLRYARVELTREALPSLAKNSLLAWGSSSLSLDVPALMTQPAGLRPVLGLSTNLPYDITYVPGYGVTSIPSFSLEYYPARGRWTVGADVEWPMWRHYEDHRFMQVNNITLWTRRYFKESKGRYKGAYLLLSANAARYGIGWNAKGWEGEGIGASLGAGYKVVLGKRVFLDMGLALGAFYSSYDPYVYGFDTTGRYYYDYDGDVNLFAPRRNRLMWVGPTRVYISLGIDLFNRHGR